MSTYNKQYILNNKGFSLLEVSVVTIVIGLIIGALIVGADLIHVSRVQKTLAHVDAINKAVGVFQEKYHALPGDMPNAETFWGSDVSCPNTPSTTNVHKETCNGNGNSHIGDLFTIGLGSYHEAHRAWQQLANAGLYEGTFTGTRGPGALTHVIPGINAPESALDDSGYSLLYMHVPVDIAPIWGEDYKHVIVFGHELSNSIPTEPVITPQEAFAIDQKIDDSRPAYGILRTFRSSLLPNCTNTDVASNSVYNTTYTQKACSLIFITGY